MNEAWLAVAFWLPAGTLVPFIISRLTGSDWRGAFIEASLFAALGLMIVPIALGLMSLPFFDEPPINLLYVGGFVVATLALLVFRRQAAREAGPRQRFYRRED